MKSVKRAVYIAAFIAMTVIPSVIAFLVPDNGASEENRVLTEKPVFSAETYSTYTGQLDQYYSDHLPLRSSLIRAYSRLVYSLFSESADGQVIVGEGDWLFYNPDKSLGRDIIGNYLGDTKFTEAELSNMTHTLTQLQHACDLAGTEFVLLIVPDKERVYSEYMPAAYGEPQGEGKGQQLINYLADNTDIKVVYPLARLKEEKEKGQVYFRHDTHWNSRGAYVACEAVGEVTGDVLSAFDSHELVVTEADEKDLSELMGLGRVLPKETDTRIKGAKTYEDLMGDADRDSFDTWMIDGRGEGTVLMVRDSFGTEMMPYLYEQYGHLILPYRYGEEWTNYAPFFIQNYDIDLLIYEISESFLADLDKWIMYTYATEPIE